MQPVTAPSSTLRLAHITAMRRALLHDGGAAVALHGAPESGWIARSWRRCLDAGRRPGEPVTFDPISAATVRGLQECNQALLAAARPVLGRVARAIASTRYFAVLTDAAGRVLEVQGAIDRSDRRARLIARPGADLSEPGIGTSAIGAALGERCPVWLHRGEHFFDDNGSYSCAGAPVFDADGRCAGMLDLTGIDVPERPQLQHLAAQAAAGIQEGLLRARRHHLVLRMAWPGQHLGGDADALLCLDAEGRVTGANQAARQLVDGLGPGAGEQHCSDVFAAPWTLLFDAAGAAQPLELPLWSGLRVQVTAHRARDESGAGPTAAPRAGATGPLRALETELIRKAVDDAHGNVTQAARALGISRATVYRKLASRRH